jgi:predicted polyphosphate/ATP-dependent NAD kinase
MTRAGLIVNPVAGIGGRYALKGSDDAVAVARLVADGAPRVAAGRASRALRVLRTLAPDVEILAPTGEMGEDEAVEAGFAVTPLDTRPGAPTTARDTRGAAAELADRRVDLVLFAGGDGTARDVVDTVGTRVPVLGVPCGVKMRSAVFGTTPEAAGEASGRYLANPARWPLVEAEVLDAGDGALASELFGIATVPSVEGRLQRGKAAPPRSDDAALTALCDEIARELEPSRLYLFGPGTTTGRVVTALGLEPTALGVDAVRDGRLVASDLDEDGILALVESAESSTLVLGVIGGQGFLLGRGNQQISARVLRAVGPENIVVIAGADKVAALEPPVLHVDLGDAAEEHVLRGYRRVRVAPGRTIVLRLA